MAPTGTRSNQIADAKVVAQFNPHDSLHQTNTHSRRGQNIQPGTTSQSGNQNPNRNGGSGYHIHNNDTSNMTQRTPLFDRLVTEEVQELKAYARIIENQNRRLAELERVHGDLEARLELESRGRVQLETTLEEREREWAIKFQQLEADRDHWKEVVKVEQTKNARLIDQVVRKDQDIHRMLQRKYDNQRESQMSSHSIRNVRQLTNERQGAPTHSHSSQDIHQRGEQQFKSPHDFLVDSGSMETVRIRNVKNLIMDFFAL